MNMESLPLAGDFQSCGKPSTNLTPHQTRCNRNSGWFTCLLRLRPFWYHLAGGNQWDATRSMATVRGWAAAAHASQIGRSPLREELGIGGARGRGSYAREIAGVSVLV